jgi:DNA polymerase I
VPVLDLFLLGGSYRAHEDGVVVELYGKTAEGEPLVARHYGFRPYFVLLEPSEETLARVRAESEFVAATPGQQWVHGAMRDVVRITLRHPWVVPELRERYRKGGEEASVLACDIPFVHRFLYDKGLGLCVSFAYEPEPEEVRRLYTVPRVVRVVEADGAPIRPIDPFRPPLTTLAFDIENAIRERTIFTICGALFRGDEELRRFRLSDDSERRILERFVDLVRETDPDVITGYNIGGYDIPLLIERARELGLKELPLGRDLSPPSDAGERLWRVHGRVIADAWWSARRELKPKQETLQHVSRLLLGEGKFDVDRRNIEAEWARDHDRVMAYCEQDAVLAYKILHRLRALERAADLATVAHLPLEEGLNGRTSLFVDSLLIPRADRHAIGVPPTRRLRREEAIEGGYVHTIRPGIHQWVVMLDFKAMYPSIIIAKNICFTTLSPTGETKSPAGARFVGPEVRRGLIPEILGELMADRDRFRRLARGATSPAERLYYDGLQNAVKILMNSFYGVMASSFYRFTNKEIGAAITAFAREAITSIIRALETDGHEVVYSDTDSVFVRSPTPSLEGARAFGESLAKRFTEIGSTFEFQAVYEALFSHGAKKRYVGRAVWPTEELVIRGYETRRTDAFDYQSESLLEVFNLILNGDTAGAVSRSRELVNAVREGQVPIERLVIARTVRPEEQYNEATREALPFLRIFRQLKSEGYDVIPGMKVAWIVTDARQSPQAVEPWVEGRPFVGKPDFTYYAERVAQTLARVTEVFDWDAAALLRGSHQQRLDLGEAAPKATAAPVTLDSPVAELAQERPKRARANRSLADFDA